MPNVKLHENLELPVVTDEAKADEILKNLSDQSRATLQAPNIGAALVDGMVASGEEVQQLRDDGQGMVVGSYDKSH